jgi:hypothetical protein
MTRKRTKARTLQIMRSALTSAENKYGQGGREKTYYRPRPITLAKISMSTKHGDEDERTGVQRRD